MSTMTLYRRACELVHHEQGCPAVGRRGDGDCQCDAVPFLRDLQAHLAQPAQAVDVGADDRFEQYVATLIAKNPDVQKLGERLAHWLDDDKFNNIEPELLGIARALSGEKAGPVGDGPALPPVGWRPCSKCQRYGRKDDCTRCGGSGWRKKCHSIDCAEYGCDGGRHCYIPRSDVDAELERQLAPTLTASSTPDKEGQP